MGIVYIIGAFMGLGILFCGSLRYKKGREAVYLGAGRWLYERLPRAVLLRIEDVKILRQFQVATKEELVKKARERAVRLLGIVLSVFTLLQGLGALLYIKKTMDKPKEQFYLNRDSYDGEETVYSLFVTLDEDNVTTVTLPVSARTYSEEELNQMFDQGFKEAWEQVLGDNEAYTSVERPLCLIQELSESPMHVSLWWEEENYINEEGELMYDAFRDGTQMLLYLELSYQGQKRQQQMPIILKKPVYTKTELLLKRVKDCLISLEKEDTTKEVVTVPTSLYGASVTLEESKQSLSFFFVASIVLPALLCLKAWQDEKEEGIKRSRQLREDYPKLLYKMVLYLGAGRTMKGCFEAISREWSEEDKRGHMSNKSFNGPKKRYLQAEIYAMVQELSMGIPELTCYEEWGKQLNEPQYLKLSNLIMKNLSKGSVKLLSLLKQERSLAIREYREEAKKRGEEASTRLLFPMLLLLLTTMLIVLIPAFYQFII